MNIDPTYGIILLLLTPITANPGPYDDVGEKVIVLLMIVCD